ncbi:MAG: tRNA glutamyl-Q(34) synthetase GluQRS [Silvanigrellaceae bacterium]|nr:tRNA glutamyl-Q(34) synthetase GluQRS [Silvanigrellaceae bacterium]
MTKFSNYVGRFAPSPTGDLHFGSLVTAVASYLRARSQNGKWLLRIEDIDQKRNQKGSIYSILKTLEMHGLEWDDEIIYQSQRSEIYRFYLNYLNEKKLIYKCSCSRKKLINYYKNLQTMEYIYPGVCRNKEIENKDFSTRIKAFNTFNIKFTDNIQASIEQNLEKEVGDFVLWRNENIASYQLAVVVDDEIQGITEIVRGSDLLFQTTRQIYLQKCLNFKTLNYAHIPILLNKENQKLSKQTKAEPLKNLNAKENICKILNYIGFEEFIINYLNKNSKNSIELINNSVPYFDLSKINKVISVQFE